MKAMPGAPPRARRLARVLGSSAVVAALGLAQARTAAALDGHKSLAQYVVAEWTQSDDGLPQNLVAAIAQTPDGYLWLATQEGLVRFDGVRFTVLSARDTPGLVNDDVSSLLVDREGALWIGTRGGGVVRARAPAKAGEGLYTTFRVKDGLAHDFVVALHEDASGDVWVGTRGGGVRVIGHAGGIRIYRREDGLPGDTAWAIEDDGEGGTWLGTDGGLAHFQRGAFTTLGVREGLTHPVVQSLHRTGDGALWIGTKGGGLDRLLGGAIEAIGAREGLARTSVLAIASDRDGNTWIGTDGDGIFRITSGAVVALSSRGAGDSSSARARTRTTTRARFDVIRAFHEDREGSLWVGMEGTGLARLTDGKVTPFGEADGLPSEYAWTTYEDAAGALWVGTKRGLARLEGGRFTVVTAPAARPGGDALGTPIVLAMTGARDGGLWLGTDGAGIGLLARGAYTQWDVKSGLPNDTVRALHEEPDGTLWIGTYANGLTRFKDGVFTTLGPEAGVPNAVVTAFAASRDHALWIGTDGGGLLRMQDGRFTRWTAKDGLSSDIIQSLHEDETGNLWIGTYGGGLDLHREGARAPFTAITTRDGLWNDVVYQIVDDGSTLWMTSNKGIHRVPRRELLDFADGRRARVTGVGLGLLDGMTSSECNSGAPGATRTRDGRLWFATVKGAAMVDPAHMPVNARPPPVLIERVEVNRVRMDLDPAHARPLSLAPDSKDFAFHYTALSLRTPEKVRFKYRLEGFDRDWVDAGARRAAYYTNLAPGHYRFRVIAANDDGVWNDEGAETSLDLAPRFHQTVPFYVGALAAVGLLGAAVYRLRVRQLRALARNLERKVEERTRQLARANQDVTEAFRALAEKDALLHEDLLQAQAFQQRILPRLPEARDGDIVFHALYQPAEIVGGDVYDVCEIGARSFRVFVADTTGHGVQASLRTMVLKTEYDRIKLAHDRADGALTELNRKIATMYPGLEMRCSACCFDVTLLPEGGARVDYASAAHPPLLHVSGGEVTEVSARGTFVGIADDVTFTAVTLPMRPGDMLLAYTDGIYEQEDAGGSPFGLERVEALLATPGLHADRALATIDAELRAFAGARARDDDMLMIAIELAPRAG